MSIPTAPYASSSDVAIFFADQLHGLSDFVSKDDLEPTMPTLEIVNSALSFSGTHIDMQLRSAGYKVPLAVFEEEAWPASQTQYLKFLNALGAASLVSGQSLHPLPKRNKEASVFQDLYSQEMNKIYDARTGVSQARLRADCYRGTPAEQTVSEPHAPVSDHLEGYHDPMRERDVFEVGQKLLLIERVMSNKKLYWDYAYGIFDIDKGFGVAVGER